MAYVSFYDGSRSISMGSKNTWSDWHLIPDGMPLVEPPPIKSNKGDYVDVPGAHGSLDYTGILSGIKYGDREGSWTFFFDPDYGTTTERYREILSAIHGMKVKVVLLQDAGVYYVGRIFVNKPEVAKDGDSLDSITFDYRLEPFTYPNNDGFGTDHDGILIGPGRSTGTSGKDSGGSSTSGGGSSSGGGSGTGGGSTPGDPTTPTVTPSTADWLWNDLFDTTATYGRFVVYGTKGRNLINSTEKAITPVFSCSEPVIVTFGDNTYELPAGTSSLITLQPGDNIMAFKTKLENGSSTVVVNYSGGGSL